MAPYFAHFPPPHFTNANLSSPSVGLNLSTSSPNSSSNNNSSSSPSSTLNSSSSPEDKTEKMSRSTQYKKIMKPLLERKRRARINKCLDELKDIMTAALQSQGENVSKLEKADILELTVRHLHKMQQARRLMTTSRNPLEEIHRFQAGYSSCAQEAASFLLSTPGVDITVGQRLLAHLTSNMANPIALPTNRVPPAVHQAIPPALPVTSTSVTSATSPPFPRSAQPPHPVRSTPLRRSSSPNLSPSKRLFHSPPIASSSPVLPPRPSSTPVNNNYAIKLTVTHATSDEDDEDSPKMP